MSDKEVGAWDDWARMARLARRKSGVMPTKVRGNWGGEGDGKKKEERWRRSMGR